MSRFRRVRRVAFFARFALSFALILQILLVSLVHAAERQMVVIDGADYFGLDYETLKEVDLAGCKAACIADAECQAFTYNSNARWCFLKSDYGDLRAFEGAISGYVVTDGAVGQDLHAVRVSELGFLRPAVVEEARALAERMRTQHKSARGSFDAIVADAQAAQRSGNPKRAAELFGSALKVAPASHSLWLQLAEWIARQTARWIR